MHSHPSIDTVTKRLDGASCAVLLDIDETLLNPLPLYHRDVNAAMGLAVSVAEIEAAGGLDGLFKGHPRYAEFRRIADQLRADPMFNSDVPLIDGALGGVKELEATPGLVIGAYLTTRPVVVTEVTEQDLMRKGFPCAPVLGRPMEVVRESTVSWKMSVLQSLNESVDARIVMIDDSLALGQGIREVNRDGLKRIVAVVFNGPLTYTAVARQGIASCAAEDFFVAEWDDIPRICSAYVR